MKEIYNGSKESCQIHMAVNKSMHIRCKIMIFLSTTLYREAVYSIGIKDSL